MEEVEEQEWEHAVINSRWVLIGFTLIVYLIVAAAITAAVAIMFPGIFQINF